MQSFADGRRCCTQGEVFVAAAATVENMHLCFGTLAFGITLFDYNLDCWCEKVVPSNFVFIRGGEFMMGSSDGEVGRKNDEVQHQVRLSDFYMSKYAVTVADFKSFVEATGYRTGREQVQLLIFSFGENLNWRQGVFGSVLPQSEENHTVLRVDWRQLSL